MITLVTLESSGYKLDWMMKRGIPIGRSPTDYYACFVPSWAKRLCDAELGGGSVDAGLYVDEYNVTRGGRWLERGFEIQYTQVIASRLRRIEDGETALTAALSTWKLAGMPAAIELLDGFVREELFASDQVG